jgi:hypothetical protein
MAAFFAVFIWLSVQGVRWQLYRKCVILFKSLLFEARYSTSNSITIDSNGYHPSISFRSSKHWIVVVYLAYHRHMSTKFPAPSHPSSNGMTLVSDDPSYWPVINSLRIGSYVIGSWRAVRVRRWRLNLTLIVVFQLPLVLEWYMIGVSITTSENCWFLTSIPALTFGQEVCWYYDRGQPSC